MEQVIIIFLNCESFFIHFYEVSPSELDAIFQSCGSIATPADVQEFFASADTNHDGELSQAEFLKSFMELQNPKAKQLIPADLLDRVLFAALHLKSSLPFEMNSEENLSQLVFDTIEWQNVGVQCEDVKEYKQVRIFCLFIIILLLLYSSSQ